MGCWWMPLHGQGAPMIDYRERLTPVLRALEQDPDLSIEALASRASPSTTSTGCSPPWWGRPRRDVPPPADAAGGLAALLHRCQRHRHRPGGRGLAAQAFIKAFRRHMVAPGAFRRDKGKTDTWIARKDAWQGTPLC